MFLRNRELRIRVARTDNPTEEVPEATSVTLFDDPDMITKILKDVAKYTAITIGTVLVVSTFLHTISEIAINKSKNKNDE